VRAKSTLINTLLGFHKPAAGTARIFGRDIRTHAREVRSLVGYMPENDAFIAGMSGVRFVRLMAELAGLPREHALERAHEAFFLRRPGRGALPAPWAPIRWALKQAAKLAQAIAHGPSCCFWTSHQRARSARPRAHDPNSFRRSATAATCT